MPALQFVIRLSLFVYRKKQSQLTTNDERRTTNQPGFTLLELLITISIIAILAAVGMTTFSQSQKLARDSKRKQDLRSIAIALELFYQKNNYYPNNGTDGWYSSHVGGTWITPLDTNYINKQPVDPLQSTSACNPANTETCFNYSYFSGVQCGSTLGSSFYLGARLENDKDPDAVTKVQYRGSSGTYCDWLLPPDDLKLGLFAITN